MGNADRILVRLYTLPPRTLQANTFRHSIHLPANLFNHTLYRIDIDKIVHNINGRRPPRRKVRLDDSTEELTISLDGPYLELKTSGQHEDGESYVSYNASLYADRSRA